nr:cytochrome P450 4c3-like [Lytechinus pictus]
MSYVNCVVKESLRLMPTVPGIVRNLEDDIIVDGKVVPKGTSIFVNIVGVHRDPEQFPDPARFDPDRFLPDNSAKRHPFAFIPFSAGPRNCIGQRFAMMEVKVILRKFSIKSLQTLDEAKPGAQITIKPTDGTILVKLIQRM